MMPTQISFREHNLPYAVECLLCGSFKTDQTFYADIAVTAEGIEEPWRQAICHACYARACRREKTELYIQERLKDMFRADGAHPKSTMRRSGSNGAVQTTPQLIVEEIFEATPKIIPTLSDL